MAVGSPLLETTITGATDVLINVSGDITLMDANDAAQYVRDMVGDDVNIIFGALYDANKSGNCTITVIATGIDDVLNTVAQNRMSTGFGYKAPTVNPGFSTPVTPSIKVPTTPVEPAVTLNKPIDIQSNVKSKSLNIPDFLTRK
jgi:cell division protein FtsZ